MSRKNPRKTKVPTNTPPEFDVGIQLLAFRVPEEEGGEGGQRGRKLRG